MRFKKNDSKPASILLASIFLAILGLASAADPSDDCIGVFALLGRDPPSSDADCTDICGLGTRTGDRHPEFWTECTDGRITSFINVPGACDGGWSSSIPCVEPLPIDQLPVEVGLMTELERLYLRNNNIGGEIPKEIGQLTKLTLLGLGGNDFEGLIPEELGNLVNLENFLLTPGNSGLTGSVPEALCAALGVSDVPIGTSPTSTSVSNTPQVWSDSLSCRTIPQPFLLPCDTAFRLPLPGTVEADNFCANVEVFNEDGPIDDTKLDLYPSAFVGWNKAGESYSYPVAVSTTVEFEVQYTLAGGYADGSTNLSLYFVDGDGASCSTATQQGQFIFDSFYTGSSTTFVDYVAGTTLTLTPDSTVITMCVESGSNFNIDKFLFSGGSAAAPTLSPTTPAPTVASSQPTSAVPPTPVTSTFDADYIIVGAGPAGSIVAERLARHPSHPRVVLLEAGERTAADPQKEFPDSVSLNESLYFNVPGLWGQSCAWNDELDCPTDWQYDEFTVPFTEGAAYRLWAGKNTGGNGQQNGMQYMKGSRADFELWAALGPDYADAWGPDVIEQYFKLHENASETLNAQSPDSYGTTGRIAVDLPLYKDPGLLDWFLEAWQDTGMPLTNDQNGPNGTLGGVLGSNWSKFNIGTDGDRSDSFSEYIGNLMNDIDNNAADGADFTLITSAQVTRILFNNDTIPSATGVEYFDSLSGTTKTLTVGREVILSAGALNSPTILLRSGVGSAADLEPLGIDVVLDLPAVGSNLVDHCGINFFLLFFDGTDTFLGAAYDPSKEIENWDLYNSVPPSGPLLASGVPVTGFFRYPEHMGTLDPTKPDGETDPGGFAIVDGPNLQMTVLSEVGFHGGCNSDPCTGFRIPVINNQPKSRGSVKLASKDFNEQPIIVHNYMSVEDDIVVLWNGFLKAREVASQPSIASRAFESFPGDLVTDFDSFKKELLQGDLMLPPNHHGGSCQMGPDGAVDYNLIIHGLANVRVIDASVMPGHTVSVNPHATVMAVGERGVAFIIDDLDLALNSTAPGNQ